MAIKDEVQGTWNHLAVPCWKSLVRQNQCVDAFASNCFVIPIGDNLPSNWFSLPRSDLLASATMKCVIGVEWPHSELCLFGNTEDVERVLPSDDTQRNLIVFKKLRQNCIAFELLGG